MIEARGGLKFLLISEDSGRDWLQVQRRFAQLLLRSIDSEADLSRVEYTPLDHESARFAARANRWREQKPDAPVDESVRVLLRSIATQILVSNQFCSFHFDGDSTWSNREASSAYSMFDEVVTTRIRREITERLRASAVPEVELSTRVDAVLSRLLLVVPHYSIEAWLFQNTDVLRAACARRNAGEHALAECSARCDEWAADRALLDEVAAVKSAVCAGDTANGALAEGFSNRLFDSVVAADKSLAATRERWRSSAALVGARESIRR